MWRVRTSPPGSSLLPWTFLFQITVGPFFGICMITHHCTKFFPQKTHHWRDPERSDHNSEILVFPHLWLPCRESSQETLKDVARSSPVFPSQSNYRMSCFILFCFSYTGLPSLGPWAAGILINLTACLTPPTPPFPSDFKKGNKTATLPPPNTRLGWLSYLLQREHQPSGWRSQLPNWPTPSQHLQSILKFPLQIEICWVEGGIFLLLISKIKISSGSA